MDFLCVYITILFVSLHLLFCASDDRLTPGEVISINQTLVSDGGAFALGFFTPSNPSNHFYVGIWYATLPTRTIVWVANREKPLPDSSGVLAISNDSNLVLLDSRGNAHWSTNVSAGLASDNSSAAVLLNTGNFIIRQGDGSVLWQSFDHPTDTFLPGMKLQYNYKTHFTRRITSWRDSSDPSPGNFSLGVDPSSTLQLFTWRGSQPYWRTSAWDGDLFAGARAIYRDNIYLSIIATEDEIYLTFSLSDGSPMARYTLDPTGRMQLLSWDDSSKNWSLLWFRPFDCDTYGLCGPFGYCDSTTSVPTCMCLEGFEPRFENDWRNGNFSGGCFRRTALECGKGDGFWGLSGMKVPDRFIFLHNTSMSECEAHCLCNCSCTAYAYANLSKGSNHVSRCLVWFEDLIDVEQVGTVGEVLYFRLAASELGGKRGTKIIFILLPVGAAILLIACIFIVWKCRNKVKDLKKKRDKVNLVYGSNCGMEFSKEISCSNEYGEGKSGDGAELRLFTIECIAVSTNNFSDSCELGQGGFGKVYKGKLPGGKDIAVKRLSRGSGQGVIEFKTEAGLIAKLQHRNLVRLLGCCIQGEEKILIYEYMANKSLDAFLFDATNGSLLNWQTRFDIIIGIARGLLYLHRDSRLRIIHRDLKVSNILLEEEMNPKISDFGMARIFGGDQNEGKTNPVVGTYGYMSPEYAMEGLFSTKSDVYSFGVILLEIVSGSRNNSLDHFSRGYTNLLSYAWDVE